MQTESALVPLTVVGIGEDGWDGLGSDARDAIAACDVLVGSERQLALVPEMAAARVTWPSPMMPFVDEVVRRARTARVTVLASGDPLLYGIGNVLARKLPSHALRIVPHVSSPALACARLCWPLADVEIVSVVARPVERIARVLQPGRRLIVLSENGETPRGVAALLVARGFGASTMDVFERLGGRDESHQRADAHGWGDRRCADLNVIGIVVVADPATDPLPLVPGLRDDVYESDGALTKREIRATALASLAPLPGQLLWDVGAGSGSIGIEWMRSDPSCRAIAFERDPERAARIARNAEALGVPELRVVIGEAPACLIDAEIPDAIFIGGGMTVPGLIDTCWSGLRAGGRLVMHGVTLEAEATLAQLHAQHGGSLLRIAIARAEPLGAFRTWRALLPVTQWTVTK